MKKICKLLILAAALTGGISLNSCIDLDPVDYSDINLSTNGNRYSINGQFVLLLCTF